MTVLEELRISSPLMSEPFLSSMRTAISIS